ncbi:hypothetical protein V8C86DRAFT_2443793 [Haematococcus lacustris]
MDTNTIFHEMKCELSNVVSRVPQECDTVTIATNGHERTCAPGARDLAPCGGAPPGHDSCRALTRPSTLAALATRLRAARCARAAEAPRDVEVHAVWFLPHDHLVLRPRPAAGAAGAATAATAALAAPQHAQRRERGAGGDDRGAGAARVPVKTVHDRGRGHQTVQERLGAVERRPPPPHHAHCVQAERPQAGPARRETKASMASETRRRRISVATPPPADPGRPRRARRARRSRPQPSGDSSRSGDATSAGRPTASTSWRTTRRTNLSASSSAADRAPSDVILHPRPTIISMPWAAHNALKALVNAALTVALLAAADWRGGGVCSAAGRSAAHAGQRAVLVALAGSAAYEAVADPLALWALRGRRPAELASTVAHHAAVLVWTVGLTRIARVALAQVVLMTAYRAGLYAYVAARALGAGSFGPGRRAVSALGVAQFGALAVTPAVRLLGCPGGMGADALGRREDALAAAQLLFLAALAAAAAREVMRSCGLVLVLVPRRGRPLMKPLWVPLSLRDR